MSSTGFSLGKEAGGDGSFERQESAFRGWVSDDGSNPSGLIAVMPDVDFGEPHGREGLGA